MSVNMKKYSAVLLLLMYLMAEVGFGMHRCNVDSTSYMLPALFSNDCESVHENSTSNHSSSLERSNSSHKECSLCSSCQTSDELSESIDGYFSVQDCCDNQFFSLDIDQLGIDVRSDIELSIIDLNVDCFANNSAYNNAISFGHYANSPPLILNLRKVLTLLSNWRL